MDSVDIAAHIFAAWQQDMIFNVQDSGGSIGALEKLAEPDKLPAFVVRHSRIGDTLKQLRPFQDRFEELVRAVLKHALCVAGHEQQIESVNLLPHFNRDLLTHRPSIFPRESQARVNRVRIFPLERNEIDDRIACNRGIMLFEELRVLQCENDRFPMLLG